MTTVTLDHTYPENDQIQTFWFKPEHPIDYTAGQFIELYVPHDHPDERGTKHWFTLSSSPTEKLISITTRYAGDKSSSFKKQLFKLKPGTKLQLVEPMGDFVLPKDKSLPLVFVAGGIGVTPFRSMVKYLSDTHEKRSITVLLAANRVEDLVFEQLFRDYGATVHEVVSEPPKDWSGEVGRLSAERILKLSGKPPEMRLFVSGPEPMVESLEHDLLAAGVAKSHLVSDFFPGYRADLKR
jgi:ferredoxin-NADP reductase